MNKLKELHAEVPLKEKVILIKQLLEDEEA